MVVMLIYGFALIFATGAIVAPLFAPVILGQAAAPQQRSTADQWPAYGGDAGGTRYSTLTQVTPANVKGLQVAWTYRTGELGEHAESGKSLTFEATPIHFDGRLYLSTSFGKVIALDPATGREVWTYDAKISRTMDYSEVTSRGVSSWRDPRATADAVATAPATAPAAAATAAANAPCAARIFLGTIDARLIALDAKTGQPCAGFGENGIVNLKTGVHAPSTNGDYQVTSPPAILNDHVIVGSSIGDNWNVDTGSGIVRSFDARTGALRWSWQPVARENAKGGKVGAANAWSVISVDAARDLVFVPTTSPSPDFFGGLRPGPNNDANSVVALRGSTGERVWAFQTVHHDLWDYDIAAQPTLVTVTRDGREIPAVAQATKMGSIFLLDRLTGTPIWPVEERPVPKSDIAGETISPTQPFTVKPRSLMPTEPITPDNVFGMNEKDRAECRALVAQYRSEGIYTPPSLRGTIMYPGNGSGVNWGSVAVDPSRQLLIANTTRFATLVQLMPREDFDRARTESEKKGEDYEYGAHRGAPFGMRRRTLLSSSRVPCNQPPWGTLAAVDLATGDVRWEVPFGMVPEEHPRRGDFGDKAIGTPNGGGPLVTASGLIFIGASMDAYFRAVDIESGKELWRSKLPRAGIATPMTYQAADGRQIIVIAAGGHGKMGLPPGDHVVAFALPATNAPPSSNGK
jgi:quinoprotein glucose dehydrogenase